MIDDILPEKIKWTGRVREGREWTGDVYRLIFILKKYRPDLDIDIFDVNLNSNIFEVATEYCDMFGRNVTYNPNGYLRKV